LNKSSEKEVKEETFSEKEGNGAKESAFTYQKMIETHQHVFLTRDKNLGGCKSTFSSYALMF